MSKEFKVWCETDDELSEVLTRLGREGFTWASGHNPLDYKQVSLGAPVGIITFKERIYYCQSKFDFDEIYTPDMGEISAEYYIKNGRPADTEKKKTIELEKGKLLKVFRSVIDNDEFSKELFATAPEIVAVIGVMLLKIENELFKEETDNKLYS